MLPRNISPIQSMLTIVGSLLMLIGIAVSQSAHIVHGFIRRGFHLRSISGLPAVIYGIILLAIGLFFVLAALHAARTNDTQP